MKCIASRKMVLELSEASKCHFTFFSQQQFLKFWRQKGKNLWASIPLSVLGLGAWLYVKNVIWPLCHVVIPSYGHCGITLKVFSTKRLFYKGHFVKGSFYQYVILSKGHFVQGSFCPRVILSKGHFVQGSFYQYVILSKGHFVQGSFFPRVSLSKGHFVKGSFCHGII